MNKIISGVYAASMIADLAGAAVSSAEAAPMPVMKSEVTANNIQQIQFRRDHDRDRFDRRRVEHPRFERRGGWGYYNGHRGYREYRRGYRQHNGFWFPPAAFVAGAILGGALANQPAVPTPQVYAPVQLSPSHVNWCTNRWRSYRVSDNSYQPSNGPRQLCVSPYGG
jgi:hypothetical protein